MQNFEYYMMVEVIEPDWHVFVTNMDSVSDFGSSVVSCAHCTLSVSLAVDLIVKGG